jgi:hypothetical protein
VRSQNGFDAWLVSPVIRVSVSSRHGQWYASADDFGIAGVGDSEADAYRDVSGLVETYLLMCFRDGLSYGDAVRDRPASRERPWTALLRRVGRKAERITRVRLSSSHSRDLVLSPGSRHADPVR